jgi:serine/threonine protein kinase
MSAESENVRDTLADQLASFDDKLKATADDVDMLADIQAGIGRLLTTTGSSEAQIRRVLQERYEAGALRKETFQLVKSMLDRFVTENIATSPTPEELVPAPTREPLPINPPPVATEPAPDDVFGATTIIPSGFVLDKSAEARVQVGSVLRDRFLLQEKISGGSMGVVYKAMDRRLAEAGSKDHWVAIKVLSPQLAENGQALRALQQEATKGRCLVHPNIVRFIDLDRDDDLYFLIMEWLEGRTLADILDSKDAAVIDNAAAFRIVRQIGDALDYAHSRGIVHADIKPGNIMIVPNGDAKLFDFGVARVRQQHADTEFDPGVLGALTPAYSSMQVLTSEEPVAADDVFSLGCLLYRLIAGYRVFGPRNAAEASQEGMKPQRLKGLNDSQWKALKKALSYSRVTRFSSVREFVDALDEHQDEPFRVEEPDHFADIEDEPGVSKSLLMLLLIACLAAAGGYQYGYLDPLLEKLFAAGTESPVVIDSRSTTIQTPDIAVPVTNPEPELIVEPEPESSTVTEAVSSEEDTSAVAEEFVEAEVVEEPIVEEAPVVGPDSMLVDFSTLPPPTEIIPFSPGGGTSKPVNVAIREDGPDVIIDFVRGSSLAIPMNLRLEEVGFSGNRSPWAGGQFALSNAGLIHFPAGQARGRVTLTMASDPLREADQQSTLRLREADIPNSELAIINVSLEDDDRRSFESRLPTNTIAFATDQTAIRETDPAVQIDLVRFNPDNSPLVIEYTVSDITATEGEDYFAPGGHSITFGPGQRSARLLVPLVQDAAVEGDETFVVELVSDRSSRAIDVHRHIVVTIRDDESQSR